MLTTPTVKSCPYKSGTQLKKKGKHLWSDNWWKKLCDTAKGTTAWTKKAATAKTISIECLELIREFNRLLKE